MELNWEMTREVLSELHVACVEREILNKKHRCDAGKGRRSVRAMSEPRSNVLISLHELGIL